jgi:DNA-binding NarL/FixJ family response regulator
MSRPFTEREIADIRRLSLLGLSAERIGTEIGRAESSVRIKMRELAIKDEIAETGEGSFTYVKWKPTWLP